MANLRPDYTSEAEQILRFVRALPDDALVLRYIENRLVSVFADGGLKAMEMVLAGERADG